MRFKWGDKRFHNYTFYQMFAKYNKNTMDPEFSMKSIPCGVELPDLNKRLTEYFTKTSELY